MNALLIIGGVLSLLGFLAHTFFGTREHMTTKPTQEVQHKVMTNWYQGLSAWHLVTADLFMFTALFFVLAFTDLVSHPDSISHALIAWLSSWTVAWLAVVLSRNGRPHFVKLLQWVLFILLAVCLYFGM